MTNTEAAEKLARQKNLLCHGCVHPSMVGWCEEHCQLPEAFDMAINALTKQDDLIASTEPEKTQLSEEDATSDCISRQAAIDFIDAGHLCNPNEPRWSDNEVVNFLKNMPSAQPESDKEKISDLLRNLYLFGLVHFTKEGIVRKQHYCEELWKTLFRNDEFPVWMHWS